MIVQLSHSPQRHAKNSRWRFIESLGEIGGAFSTSQVFFDDCCLLSAAAKMILGAILPPGIISHHLTSALGLDPGQI